MSERPPGRSQPRQDTHVQRQRLCPQCPQAGQYDNLNMDSSVTRRNGAVMRHRAAGATDGGGARLPLSSPPSVDSGNRNGDGHKMHRKPSEKSRYVMIGAMSVLVLCLTGMMLSSSPSGPSVNIRVDSPLPNEWRRLQKTTRRDGSRGIGTTKAVRNNGGRGAQKLKAKVTKHQIHSQQKGVLQAASKVQTQHQGSAPKRKDTIKEDRQNLIEEEDGDDDDNNYSSDDERETRETWRERQAQKKERERKMGLVRDVVDEDALQQTLQVPVKARTEPSIHVDMSLLGYEARPRHVQLEFEEVSGIGLKPSIDKDAARDGTDDEQRSDRSDEDDKAGSWSHIRVTNVTKLAVHGRDGIIQSEREINPYPGSEDYFNRLHKIEVDDKKYARSSAEQFETEECRPKHDWQTQAFPTCNVMHEYSLSSLSHMMGRSLRNNLNIAEGDGDEKTRILGHGYWRDVWLISKVSTPFSPKPAGEEELTVLKTLRYKHHFTERNYDRHRKDSLASERLSKSSNVIDIYAYCSNSAVFEYGSGGDIEAVIWPYDENEEAHYVQGLTSYQALDLAYQVARGIADIHDVEEDGIASIAHTDITLSQFILVDGRYKVNDFNRCRFMRQYKEDDSPCGFYVGANPGKFRSPEEYNYKEEDEMVDVYSMGNIFYAILTGDMPFEGQKEAKAQKKVTQGIRPKVPDEVKEQAMTDPAVEAIKIAMHKCWKQKPNERPRASVIRDLLKEALDRSKKEEEQQPRKALDDKGPNSEDSNR